MDGKKKFWLRATCLILTLFLLALTQPVQGQTTVRRRALMVGVRTYQNPGWNNLKFPDRDAQAPAEALTDPGVGAWGRTDVSLLLNERATSKQFQEELLRLLRMSEKGDFLLVYFSGHGFVAGKNTYLAVYDTDPLRPDSTAIDLDVVRLWLSKYGEGATKLLVLDACHAGAAIGATKGGSDVYGGILQRLGDMKGGLAFVTSSGAGEVSTEGTGNGLFTELFLKGLRGAASAYGPYVTLADVWNYVRKNISGQTPQLGGDLPMDLPLAIRKGGEANQPAPAPAVQDAGLGAQYELEFWKSIKDSTNPDDYRAYLNKYPNGEFAELAQARLQKYDQKVPVQEKVIDAKPASVALGFPATHLYSRGGGVMSLMMLSYGKLSFTERRLRYEATEEHYDWSGDDIESIEYHPRAKSECHKIMKVSKDAIQALKLVVHFKDGKKQTLFACGADETAMKQIQLLLGK